MSRIFGRKSKKGSETENPMADPELLNRIRELEEANKGLEEDKKRLSQRVEQAEGQVEQEKSARKQAEGQVEQEKSARKQAEGSLEKATRSTPWEILDATPQSITYVEGSGTSKKQREEAGKTHKPSTKTTETSHWFGPSIVVETVLTTPTQRTGEDKIVRLNYPNNFFDLQCCNEAAVAVPLNTFVQFVLQISLSARYVHSSTKAWAEQYDVNTMLRPDMSLEMEYLEKFRYFLVIELKPHWKWGVDKRGVAIPLSALFDSNKEKDMGPLRQIVTYMLVLRTRYGVLTTYTAWWFLRIECDAGGKIVVQSSIPIEYDRLSPSLAHHFVQLMELAQASPPIPDEEIPRNIRDALDNWTEFKKRIKEMKSTPNQLNLRGGGDDGETSSIAAELPDSCNDEKTVRSPDGDDDDVPPKITDRRKLGRTGVTWWVTYQGEKFVIKGCDTNKDKFMSDELEDENDMYNFLVHLQGAVIPRCVGLVDLGLGRLGFCTVDGGIDLGTYLDSTSGEEKRAKAAEQATNCLNILHEARVLHGDVKLENFVVDSEGKVMIIDLAASSVRANIEDEIEKKRFAEERLELREALVDKLG